MLCPIGQSNEKPPLQALAKWWEHVTCRSEHSIIRLGLGGNLWSVMAFEAGVVLLMSVLFLPGLQVAF